MKNILQNSLALAATALVLTAAASRAQTAYALSNGGTTLISFDLATPGVVTTIGGFDGPATRLDGIDFRPADGRLYGYSQVNNRVVSINLTNAVTTLVTTPGVASTTANLGIDFNPAADRLRLVNSLDQNLRINLANGAVLDDLTTLAFAAGDPNFGINPTINEAAYTNNDNNPVTGTTLFYIDPNLDILVSTINPNAGSLMTVGALGVNAGELTGFDILTNINGVNTAYALLTTGGAPSLYTVNLNTGAATAVGAITGAVRPFSLAIVAPVPEPGTLLFGFALAGVGLTRRARKSAPRA